MVDRATALLSKQQVWHHGVCRCVRVRGHARQMLELVMVGLQQRGGLAGVHGRVVEVELAHRVQVRLAAAGGRLAMAVGPVRGTPARLGGTRGA